MYDPFSIDPYERLSQQLSAGPMGMTGGGRRPRSNQPAIPNLEPEEADSLLGKVGGKLLSGLGWVGETLSKPGRALRGLMGGKPSELLNLIPFSDSLGMTDPSQQVTGRNLLEKAGVLDPGIKGQFEWSDLAGLGADILTDPLMMIQPFAPTAAGKLFAKHGAMPKSWAGRIAGAEAQAAIPAEVTAAAAREGLPAIIARDTAAATGQKATPLGSLFGFGLPFGSNLGFAGTGATGERLAGVADAFGSWLGKTAPARYIKQKFAPSVGDAYSAAGQETYSGTGHPLKQQLQKEVGETVYDTTKAVASAVKPGTPEWEAYRLLRMGSEDVPLLPGSWNEYVQELGTRNPTLAQAALSGTDPAMLKLQQQFPEIVAAGKQAGVAARKYGPEEIAHGAPSTLLEDPLAEYYPREKAYYKEAKGGVGGGIKNAFGVRHSSQRAREDILRGLPGGTIQFEDWAMNPAYSGPNATLKPLQVQSEIFDQLMPFRIPEAPEVINQQAESLSKMLHELPAFHAAEQKPFFNPDFIGQLRARGMKHADVVPAARTIQEGISQFGAPLHHFPADVPVVPVSELQKQVGFTDQLLYGTKQAKSMPSSVVPAAQPFVPQQAAAIDWSQMYVPADFAKDVTRFASAWARPEELGPVLQAADSMMALFKTWLTRPFPAFHVRNLMTDLFQTWRDDALTPRSISAMNSFMHGAGDIPIPADLAHLPPPAARDALAREMYSQNVAFAERARQSTEAAGAPLMKMRGVPGAVDPRNFPERATDLIKGLVPDASKGETLNPLAIAGWQGQSVSKNTIVQAADKTADWVNDFTRGAHYLEKRLQGFSPEMAAEAVKKYHGDWGALTSFERGTMRRIFPWYSWSRQVLPPMLEDMALRPAKLAATIRISNSGRSGDNFVPPYVGEGAAVPIGNADQEGMQRFLSGFGLPFEDESLGALGSLMGGNVKRAGQRLVGAMNPLIRTPIETISGTQMFTGRQMADLKPTKTGEFLSLGSEDVAGTLGSLIANSPASRFATTGEKLFDPNKPVADKLANLLTGARVSEVDVQKAKEIAVRDLIQEYLKGRKGVGSFEDVFVKPENIPTMSPEDLLMYRLYNTIGARGRQRAKEAKQQGP